MSTGNVSRPGSRSLKSSNSNPQRLDSAVRQTPPPLAFTPENRENALEPCAATASFLLYAQRNRILVLHHDTLAIERRFDLHREDVLWIAVDNVSERGSGRLAVSFDAGNTAIVWDLLSGGEVARFSAYEHMRVATFMRNGNIAFGNDQGNIILFEPGTSEHIAARTIFDPVTAIAPAHDCRTFAIGYLNGSILIATLQPSFTILHTLNTNRSPSRITGLAWHGSSSKQKTDMLATQTQDGDLRVWSVPKASHSEAPTIIRVLQRSDVQQPGPCWFAWSKNGRLVQLADGETRAWDVRTKKVTYDIIPTIEGVVGISNYGPTATLFTLGRNHTVQQYDINPNSVPLQVANAQHAPANIPPTPPTTLEDRVRSTTTDGDISLPVFTTDTESSADESAALSPLQKIAREMDSLDALESEIRDKVMPLSPSSHGGSVSSRSSGKAARRQQRKYLYDRPDSSRTSNSTGYDGTEFSFGASSRVAHESAKSISSLTSGGQRHRSSALRKEIMRSPQESKDTASMDLFPSMKARLQEVAFRTPHYGEAARTPELLQREMLSVVFGWNDDIRSLIREELARHRAGSASAVLLSKWLGDMGADDMASMVGSESMTSSDWMLLALSSIGSGSQKKVGETFVIRLLEKGDIHPAVAILLGLGEVNDAIEVYVSQQYPMEAVLLTCLTCPSDWGRTSYLLRKWGEHAVMNGEAELAVRCFSCTSIETTGPWTSPRAQDAVFSARQEHMMQPLSAGPVTSPTYSIPSIGSGRMTTKNAALKLITTFGDKGAPVANQNEDPMTTLDPATVTAGVTPIINSALPLSPGAVDPWRQRSTRMARDPSSARTATPGGRRKRLPSRGEIERAKQEAAELATTPLTAARDFAPAVTQRTTSRTSNRTSNSKTSNSRRTSSVNSLPEPTTALKPTTYDAEKLAARTFGEDDHLPSPAQGVFNRLREDSRNRNLSKERNLDHLTVEVMKTAYADAPETGNSLSSPQQALKSGTLSPPLTGGSSKASSRGRPTDQYISSVEQARIAAKQERAESRRRGESRKRGESRSGRASSRMRDVSETRGRGNVRYIKPAKRSPSSPVPMSPEEIAQAHLSQQADPATTDDENFYKIGVQSPVESHRSGKSGKSGKSSRTDPLHARRQGSMGATSEGLLAPSNLSGPPLSPDVMTSTDDVDGRGRSERRLVGSAARSPSSPLPVLTDKRFSGENEDTQSDGQRFRLRSKSANRRSGDDLQSRRHAHRNQRERSTSRKPVPQDDSSAVASDIAQMPIPEEKASDMSYASGSSASLDGRRRGLSRKELAARELEERRRSLARRPSAPQIPLPGEAAAIAGAQRPQIGQRSYTELGDSPTSYMPPMSRSHTVDPDAMSKYNSQSRVTGTSTPSAPIGLPATPRAMRHPRYMTSEPDERDQLPPVPDIPGKFSDFGSYSGSSLSGVTGSNMSDLSSSILSSQQQKSSVMSSVPSVPSRSIVSETDDSVGPLLPSTVFSQKGSVRSASAPPEHVVLPPYRPSAPANTRRLSHIRKISPPELNSNLSEGTDSIASIDAALHGSDAQVIIIPEEPETTPSILPELQHLAMPPPPPPPPMFPPRGHTSGMINIAIDEKSPTSAIETHAPQLPAPMERASTASPSSHRRNAPSGSGETFSARIRGIGDRMRSSSKNRTKSPPQDYKPAPYESVRPPFPGHQRRESLTQQRAQSPYEQAMAAGNQPISPSEAKINETSIPPSSLPGSRTHSAMGGGGYRNPKEIRANMPPEVLQQGVYPGSGGFL